MISLGDCGGFWPNCLCFFRLKVNGRRLYEQIEKGNVCLANNRCAKEAKELCVNCSRGKRKVFFVMTPKTG